MITYPTLRQAEQLIKNAIPCDDCDCKHLVAKLELQIDGTKILARTLRLGCGKVPLIDFRREGKPAPEPAEAEEEAAEVEESDEE